MGLNTGRVKRAFRQLRTSPNTWLLVRILLIVQAVPVIWDLIEPDASKLYLAHHALGLIRDEFLAGKVWQLASYGVIHGNWFHLLANAACIILLGSKLEHIVSKSSLWLLTLFSILAGGICFLLLSPVTQPGNDPQILVGSSAVCFGFLLLLTTLSPESKFMPVFLSGRTIGIAIILANLILALINPELPTGLLAGYGQQLVEIGLDELFKVSHACHLGGSLAGYFYGKWLLRPRVTLKSLQRSRAKKEARSEKSAAKKPAA